MKALKGFLLSLVVLLLFLVFVLFQINFALKSTLLSGSYFGKSFDKNEVKAFLGDFVISGLINMQPAGGLTEDGKPRDTQNSRMPDINSMLNRYLDKNWLEEQASILVKGVQSYIAGNTEKLPVLDIKPLKEAIFDLLGSQMFEQSGVSNNIADMKAIIKKLDSQYKDVITKNGVTDELIDKVMKLSVVKNSGFNREIVEAILEIYPEVSGKDITSDDIKKLTKEIMKKVLKYDNVKDTLDMNLLFENVYKGKDNILSGIRSLVAAYKNILFRTLLILITLLLLIIIVVAFKPKSFMGWTAGGLIAGGAAGVSMGLLGMLLPFIAKLPGNFITSGKFGQQASSIANLQKWMESFLTEYFTMLLLQGIALVSIGMAIIISRHVFLPGKKPVYDYKSNSSTDGTDWMMSCNDAVSDKKVISRGYKALMMISRILVAILLIAAIPYTVTRGVNDFTARIDKFSTAMQTSTASSGGPDLMNAIGDTIGAEFLKNNTAQKQN